MEDSAVIYYASLLLARSDEFLRSELKKRGYGDIKSSYGDVFHVVFTHRSTNLKTIIKETKRSKSTISELVDRLVSSGYLVKTPDPDDSRGVLISLTPKGLEFEPVFKEVSNCLNAKIFSAASPSEIRQAESVLKKITDEFEG